MKIEVSKQELEALGQALSYAVMNAPTEHETAEYAMLKIKIEKEITILKETEKQNKKHAWLGCPFKYCDSNPPCKGKCRYQ